VFVLTFGMAVLWLPSQIAMYYTPTDRPDVIYQGWQYLILILLGAFLLAFGLASGAGALMAAFGSGGAVTEGRVTAWVGAWVLVSA
jgi:Na+-driven multidrug efflux pump